VCFTFPSVRRSVASCFIAAPQISRPASHLIPFLAFPRNPKDIFVLFPLLTPSALYAVVQTPLFPILESTAVPTSFCVPFSPLSSSYKALRRFLTLKVANSAKLRGDPVGFVLLDVYMRCFFKPLISRKAVVALVLRIKGCGSRCLSARRFVFSLWPPSLTPLFYRRLGESCFSRACD